MGERAIRRGHPRVVRYELGDSLRPTPVAPADARALEVGVGETRVRDQTRRLRTLAAELSVEPKSEVVVREFGLTVRAPGAVSTFEIWIRGIDGATHEVRRAGHRDDSRPLRCSQRRQQQRGQRPVPQVVNTELLLEAVDGASLGDGHDASVVDEQVDARMRRQNRLRR